MPIRRTEATQDSPTQPKAATAHQPDGDDTNPAGDQDIDTAGTDADEHPLTRPKAATAPSRPSSSES